MIRSSRILVALFAVSLVSAEAAQAITWTGSVDSSWHTPGNWDLNHVPGTLESVVIPDLPGTGVVSYTTGTTTIQKLTCSEDFRLSGGTLSISSTSSSTKGLTIENQATLSVNGDFNISGLFSFAQGTLSGAGFTVVDTMVTWDVGAQGNCTMNRFLVNYGVGTQFAGDLTISLGKNFRNKTDAEFTARRVLGPGLFINESGAFLRSSVIGATMSCSLQNSGTVCVDSGDLTLTNLTALSGGTLSGGAYDLSGHLQLPGNLTTIGSASVILRGSLGSLGTPSTADALRMLKTLTGSIRVLSGKNQTLDSLQTSQGILRADSGGTLTFPQGYTQTAGRTELNDGFLISPSVNIAGGQLFGPGHIEGDVTNSGLIYQVPLGRLTIDGDYTQTSTGRLNAELAGPIPGTQFDQLDVTGTATLNGTVFVSLGSQGTGPIPAPADTFQIIKAGSVTGTFSTENLPGVLVAPNCLDLVYGSNAVVFRTIESAHVVTQPQSQAVCGNSPVTLSVTAAGGSLTYQWRRNGTPIGGATSSVLAISSLTPSDAGNYDVTIGSACGADTSDTAVLSYRNCLDPVWNSEWFAGTGDYPDEGCPWIGFDDASPEQPVIASGALTMATSEFTENMYYSQTTGLSVPDTLLILARLRVVSDSHDAGSPRRGTGIFFSVAPDSGNVVFFGQDCVLIWAAGVYGQAGPMAFVDTDDQFHDYLIEVLNHSNIRIYQDNILILSGPIGVSSQYPDSPYLWWGDGTGAGSGVSQWLYVKHNANTVPCSIVSGVGSEPQSPGSGQTLSLTQPFPNPSTGALSLTVYAGTDQRGTTLLSIYDVVGRVVRIIETSPLSRGGTTLRWDGRDGRGEIVSDGIYFLRVDAGGEAAGSRRVLILR